MSGLKRLRTLNKFKDINYAKRKKKKKTQDRNSQTQEKIEKESSQEKIILTLFSLYCE